MVTKRADEHPRVSVRAERWGAEVSSNSEEISRTAAAWRTTAATAVAVAAVLIGAAVLAARPLLYVPGVLLLVVALLAAGQSRTRRTTPQPHPGGTSWPHRGPWGPWACSWSSRQHSPWWR